jgi:hypothetical protein
MASIERTAYPRFRRLVTARELASLSPSGDDVVWAREHTRSGEHLLSLVLSLVCDVLQADGVGHEAREG